MVEEKKPKLTKAQQAAMPENLRIKYSTLLAYINSVVTFRFTTLSLYLAAVAIILAAKPSLGMYILLDFITISVFIIEIRNRILKNDLGALSEQIEREWGYDIKDRRKRKDYDPIPTYIFGICIPYKKVNTKTVDDNNIDDCKKDKDNENNSAITHSTGIDLLYGSIFLYALIHIILILYRVGQ